MQKIVVGWSGGISSAWCGDWALCNYDPKDVVFLFHDTKEEDPDTYRFLYQMADLLNHPITERSDGRSVTDLIHDNQMLPNDRAAFCSRILKQEQRNKYFEELRTEGVTDIILILGFSRKEIYRQQKAFAVSQLLGYSVRFPIAEVGITKQEIAEYLTKLGVCPPRMYEWSEHANCVGCVRGGRAYWKAVEKHAPKIYTQREALEEEYDHTFINGISLTQLRTVRLRRKINQKESIEIASCKCGD